MLLSGGEKKDRYSFNKLQTNFSQPSHNHYLPQFIHPINVKKKQIYIWPFLFRHLGLTVCLYLSSYSLFKLRHLFNINICFFYGFFAGKND